MHVRRTPPVRPTRTAALLLVFAAPLLAVAACSGEESAEPPSSTGTGGTITGGTSTGQSGTGSSTSSGSGTTSSTGMGGGGGTGGAPPGAVVRIIAVGDTGEGNADQHMVADRMSEKCMMVGGCDAVMMNGDNFYDHGVDGIDDVQWEVKFEQPYDRPGLNGLLFYAVLGNHDYGATSNGVMQAQIDYSFLPVGMGPGMRASDKWFMPAAYYDVQIKHVHLFAIDTQDFTTSDQANDVAPKVASSTATWKIVFGHHPRYTSGDHYFDNQLLGAAGMFALLEATYCGADMLMTGHDHNLEFIDKGRDADCPNTHFVISGAGAKTREASALVPTDPSQLFYDEQTEGFAYMEFTGETLLFEFIDKFGVVNFSKTITK